MFASIRLASFAVVTSLAMALPGVSSAAAPVADQRSTIISYRDLDLANEQGVARLRQRVRGAVATVCGQADARDLKARADMNRCRTLAMTKAQDGVQIAIAAARSDTMLAQNTAPSITIGAR